MQNSEGTMIEDSAVLNTYSTVVIHIRKKLDIVQHHSLLGKGSTSAAKGVGIWVGEEVMVRNLNR